VHPFGTERKDFSEYHIKVMVYTVNLVSKPLTLMKYEKIFARDESYFIPKYSPYGCVIVDKTKALELQFSRLKDIHDFQQIVLLRSPRLDLQRSHPDSSSEDEADWDYEQTFESPSLPDSMSETGDEARLGHLSTADYTLSVTSNFFSKTSPNKLKSVFRLAKQSPSQIKYGAQLWTAWRPGEIRNQYMVVDDTSQLPKCLVLFPSDTTHEDTSTGATCQAPIVIPSE
jgi:hypothetical protein